MVDKAEYTFEKIAISAKALGMMGLLGAFMIPKPRATAMSVLGKGGKYKKFKNLIKIPT